MLAKQNEDIIRSVTKAMAPEAAESLRRDLAKLTRPEVWIDKDSPESALLRASSLKDLSPGVREQVADLLEMWRNVHVQNSKVASDIIMYSLNILNTF